VSLVSCLFEMLLRAEENDPRLLDLMRRTLGQGAGLGGEDGIKGPGAGPGAGAGAGAGAGGSPRLRTQQEQIAATVATLGIFSEAHPPLLLPHIDALVPYLKGDSSLSTAQETQVSLTVVNVLTSVAMLQGVQLTSPISEINADLSNIALKYGLNCINAAVGCLATIAAHMTHDASDYMSLAEKCFNAIASVAKTVAQPKDITAAQVARIQRSIVVLGAVCEHSRKCWGALRALRGLGGGGSVSSGSGAASPGTAATSRASTPSAQQAKGKGKDKGKDKDKDKSKGKGKGNSSKSAALAAAVAEAAAAAAAAAAEAAVGAESLRRAHDREEAVARKNIVDIARAQPNALNGCCYSAAMYALSLPFESVQVRAAQALCFVFAGCPRLIMISQDTGLLASLLSDRFPPSLHR